MDTLGWIVVTILLVHVAVCLGKIAVKHGKNPILYGILSIISPVSRCIRTAPAQILLKHPLDFP